MLPGTSDTLESKMMQAIDERSDRLIELADQIHEWAELGYDEHRSSALLAAELTRLGLTVTTGVAGLPTAFHAVLRGTKPGPHLALLAEYDALPGLGHACGHNLIGAAAIGAAELYDEMIPNPTLNRLFLAALADAGAPPELTLPEPPGPVTHSDDTGIISKHVPTVSGRVMIGPPGLILHTVEATEAARSVAGHDGMLIGAKVMALTAWRLANSPDLVLQAKADLAAARPTSGSDA